MSLSRYWRRFDGWLVFAVMALMVYGVVALASATRFDPLLLLMPEQWLAVGRWSFVQRQIVWVILGWTIIAGCQLFDYRALTRWAYVLYALSLALLVAVLFVGDTNSGAERWISFGFVQVQPSEFAKLALIILLATVMEGRDPERQSHVESWGDVGRTFLSIVPPLVLIIKQPDLGTALVLFAIFAGMLLVAGIPLVRFVILSLGGLAAAIGALLLKIYFDAPIPLRDYQLRRLIIFLNPASDPFGDGYHIIQSQYAIASGQLYGRGLFHGEQSGLNYLPERHTDFIFSVVGEELGFIGASVLILLLLLMLWRIFWIAGRAKDPFGALLVTGIGTMYAFHAIVNIGMTIGLMPVTGLPLPFVSYGGSSLLVNSLGIGLALNVCARRHKLRFGD